MVTVVATDGQLYASALARTQPTHPHTHTPTHAHAHIHSHYCRARRQVQRVCAATPECEGLYDYQNPGGLKLCNGTEKISFEKTSSGHVFLPAGQMNTSTEHTHA